MGKPNTLQLLDFMMAFDRLHTVSTFMRAWRRLDLEAPVGLDVVVDAMALVDDAVEVARIAHDFDPRPGYTHRGMTIPADMLGGLRDYVAHGVEPGSFLSAVISNDLKEACARADHRNARIIPAYVAWLYNEAPSTCWGSRERMDAWVEARAQERAAARAEGAANPGQTS